MLLFAISADLDYPIFTDSNDNFKRLFVRVFTKADASLPHFYKSSYRLESVMLLASVVYAVCISALNCFSFVVYDVINYKDLVSAAYSYESVKYVGFTVV